MNILPREEKFFELLNTQTRLITEAAGVLLEGVQTGHSHLKLIEARIEQYEHECDEILHEVFKRLNQTFITPLDPEDIQSLCSHLDDVMDGMEEAAHCIVSYKIDPIPQPIVDICGFLLKAVAEVKAAVEVMDKNREILKHCIEINRLEGQVDQIVRQAVVDLFDNETNPILIMKLKEIYDVLEWTVDSCEDVSDVLQTVVVKNS
jgi:predicted phosphate transport protein (TIGR00153 family)